MTKRMVSLGPQTDIQPISLNARADWLHPFFITDHCERRSMTDHLTPQTVLRHREIRSNTSSDSQPTLRTALNKVLVDTLGRESRMHKKLLTMLFCAALAFWLLWVALRMHDPTVPVVRPETRATFSAVAQQTLVTSALHPVVTADTDIPDRQIRANS
jgi:hypothetical protein